MSFNTAQLNLSLFFGVVVFSGVCVCNLCIFQHFETGWGWVWHTSATAFAQVGTRSMGAWPPRRASLCSVGNTVVCLALVHQVELAQ